MTEKIIPEYIMHYFKENPKISRNELSQKAGISNQKARFYVQVYRSLNQKNNNCVKKGIVLFDIHYPDHNKACINIIEKAIKVLKPDYLIFGGDQLHLDCISHHNKGKVKLLENRRLYQDYRGFQKHILDRLEKSLPAKSKKYFMIGNHEYWIDRLLEESPQLEGLINIENNLNLQDYTIIPFNEMLSIGEINIIHGIFTNKYHSEHHLRVYQKMLFYGHLHTNQVYTQVTPKGAFPRQAVGVGCLCNKNAHYLRNKPNDWLHQFLIFYLFADGSFVYETPIILNNRTIINGKVINGSEEKI